MSLTAGYFDRIRLSPRFTDLRERAREVLKHVARLWGFPVHLHSVHVDGEVRQQWTVMPSDTI